MSSRGNRTFKEKVGISFFAILIIQGLIGVYNLYHGQPILNRAVPIIISTILVFIMMEIFVWHPAKLKLQQDNSNKKIFS